VNYYDRELPGEVATRVVADLDKILGFVQESAFRFASFTAIFITAMIAIVIAYQAVVQLRPYGGEDFTINLVAVSMLREMGVLITAIMVAGRSGSAFTAELGVMKAREEIDALHSMGLDPMRLLVVPRLIGLLITLPLLTFFADAVGLFGGAMATQALLHVSPAQFFDHVRHAVDTNDLMVGLMKAPVFAVVIAIIGCMHGLRVHGSAESVGHQTTRAVVKAIFLVIVLAVIFQPSLTILILVIGFTAWLVPARLVRGETLSLRVREYVLAVRVMGGSNIRIVVRHIIPNTIGTIIVNATDASTPLTLDLSAGVRAQARGGPAPADLRHQRERGPAVTIDRRRHQVRYQSATPEP
jgi:ABC transport permease subunit